MKNDRLNLVIYGANIIFLIFSIWVLLWLNNRFKADVESTIQKSTALFPRSVMRDPDNRQVDFAQWEQRAQIATRSQFVRDIFVSKIIQENGQSREVVVQPFWYSARHGNSSPQQVNSNLRREALRDSEGIYGAIYFELDLSPLKTVQFAIYTLGGLLALALILLTTRMWTQERALTKTTIELEEKSKQLIRLERLALVGQLTANIFHDVRKPILNIRHELDDLGETLGNFAGASKGLLHIREHVELFFAMLRELNLERFVSSREEEAEYVEMAKVMEQACRLVQYERGAIQLEYNAAPALPLVLAPPYRLIQVFSNLVLNAYQAMQGKGNLRVSVRKEEKSVEVEIADSGPGISPMHLPYIFMPFFSTKANGEGTGLGLYISKQIIEELGGEIHVFSNDAKGTVFTVSIPAAAID